MEDLDDLLYNDVEAKFLALQNKKKKRKKRRRKIKWIVLVVFLSLGVLYFWSDFSKVKSLNVSGNIFYSKQTVLEKARLSYETRYVLMPKMYLEWQLEKDSLIEEAVVEKGMDGAISIHIIETAIVGYIVENNKNYAIATDGTKYEIKSASLDIIVNFPLIDGFSQAELKKLVAAFNMQGESVNRDVIKMISEIHPSSTSYDKNRVKIVMQDGNTIYTSYDAIPLLNTYRKTLKDLKGDTVCLSLDKLTRTAAAITCSEASK